MAILMDLLQLPKFKILILILMVKVKLLILTTMPLIQETILPVQVQRLQQQMVKFQVHLREEDPIQSVLYLDILLKLELT